LIPPLTMIPQELIPPLTMIPQELIPPLTMIPQELIPPLTMIPQELVPPAPTIAPPNEEQIGGETLSKIYLRLLCEYRGRGTLPLDAFFFAKAQSIFEIKKGILLRMDALDPVGGWLVDGAQFLKTKKGVNFSLKTLQAILQSLESEGVESSYFFLFFYSKIFCGFVFLIDCFFSFLWN